MKKIRLLIAAVGLVLSGPAPLWAEQPPVERAQQATEALNAAAELMAQADSGSDRVAALSEAIRAYEQGLAAMREGLRAAAIRERYLTLDFDSRREQLSQLLGVLQTLERATTPLLLIHPTGPVGTARSGMMMSEVTPALNRQAEELRAQNINVNAVLPSIIDTPPNREGMPDADFDTWVAPEDLAEVICFLASPGARAVHGALLPVRGLS